MILLDKTQFTLHTNHKVVASANIVLHFRMPLLKRTAKKTNFHRRIS